MAEETPLYESEADFPGFVSGELMITPYDPASSPGLPGGTTWVLSRWFYFEEDGQYDLKVVADDYFTLWIGSSRNELSMVVDSRPFDGTVHTYSFFTTKGLKRLDFRIVNTPDLGMTPSGLAFSLWRGNAALYVSRVDKWSLGLGGIFPPDTAHPGGKPVVQQFYPLLAVEPNWKNGIYERLTWFTDVLTSDTNAEQRRAIRTLPRRSFTVNFLRQRAARALIDNFLTGTGNGPCLVPLYHEPVRLPEGTAPDSTGIAFSGAGPSAREIETGSLVMVTAGDPAEYDLLQVGAVEPTRFDWATYPTRRWPPGSVMYPVRVARITGTTAMENIASSVARLQVAFDHEQPDIGIPPPSPIGPEEEVLFQFPCNWREGLRYDYNRRIFTNDNQSGIPWTIDPGGDSFVVSQFTVTMYGRAEVQRFRRFIAQVRGRSRSFFFLDPTDDVIPAGDIDGVSSELLIEDSNFAEFFQNRPQPIRRRIGMLSDGRSPEYRTIVDIGPRGGLLLDSPFPATPRDKIIRIAYLAPARLDQDTVELRHYVGLSNAVEARVSIRQYGQRRIETGA